MDSKKIESRPLGPKFEEAFNLAFELHQTRGKQGRKGTDTPYISHLMAVSALVMEFGGSEEEAIAALLHDAVEDQGGKATLRLIRRQFGGKVAKIVADCSDSEGDPKPPWLERKKKYIAHVPGLTASSRIVSLADKIHNAATVLRDVRNEGVGTFERFNGKRDGTLWYYDALARAFSNKKRDPMVVELDRIVAELYAEAGLARPQKLVPPKKK